MTTDEKIADLIEFCRKLSYRQNIICSDEGNLKVPSSVHEDEQKINFKPTGLWFGSGSAWVDLLTEKFNSDWGPKRLIMYTHVYKLILNNNRIVHLHNSEDIDAFTKSYGCQRRSKINWKKVRKDGHTGIAISYNECKDRTIPWYNGWDCSSGCIWDRSAVRKFELLKEWKITKWEAM